MSSISENTVHVSGFSEERLKLKHPGTKARVIQMLEKQIVTKDVLEEVPWIESDGEKYFCSGRGISEDCSDRAS